MPKDTITIMADTTNTDTVINVTVNQGANNGKVFLIYFLDKDGQEYYDYFTRDEMTQLLNSRK